MKSKVGVVAGFILIILGFGSNQLVYHLNGGMPVSGVSSFIGGPIAYGFHTATWSKTRLVWLSDIFHLPGGWYSIGDILLASGLLIFFISSIIYLYCRYGRALRRKTSVVLRCLF